MQLAANDTMRNGSNHFCLIHHSDTTQTRPNTDDRPPSSYYLMISLTGKKKKSKEILYLYDYHNDLMPLVILVIKYINSDDDLE